MDSPKLGLSVLQLKSHEILLTCQEFLRKLINARLPMPRELVKAIESPYSSVHILRVELSMNGT